MLGNLSGVSVLLKHRVRSLQNDLKALSTRQSDQGVDSCAVAYLHDRLVHYARDITPPSLCLSRHFVRSI